MTSKLNDEWAQLIHRKIEEVSSSAQTSHNTIDTTVDWSKSRFARVVDHTLLKADATPDQIHRLCDEAIKHKFKSCCVNGANIKLVTARLKDEEDIVPCAVVGFPLGASTTRVKVCETEQAVLDGAKEIDMVINIGALKSKNYSFVYDDIHSVVNGATGNAVKVILETALLTDEEKIAGSFISAEAGATYLKTCTGFGGGGATPEDVALMKRALAYKGGHVKVKASAGLRTLDACMAVLKAGAERIGTSSGVAIMENSAF